MQKIFILIAATALTLATQAQQLNLQSRVFFARLTANPALTAYNGSTNAYGFFRDQWSGALSHPRMAGGIGEISLWNDRIGTGLEIMSYTGGITQIIDAKLYYAQKIKLAKDHRLSLGFAGGMIQRGTKATQADREMVNNDPMLDMPRAMAFDFNIGLAYQWKKLTIGFAIPNLLDANTRIYGNRVQITNFKRNYLINGSYEISIANEKFNIEPGFVMKIDQLKQVNLNLQVMADYKRTIFLGVGYDLLGGLPVTVGARISKVFTVAYTYQVPLLQGVPFTPSIYSTHELTVGLCFDKWMKKADKPKEVLAAAPQQSTYDSLVARQAAAEQKVAEQQTTMEDLSQKVDALQQALANAQSTTTGADKKKTEQEEEKAAVAEQQAKEKAAAEQQAKEKAAAAVVAEQQTKEKEAAAKAAAEAAKQIAEQETAAKEKAKQEAEAKAKAQQEAAAKAKAEQEAAAAKAKRKQENEAKAQPPVNTEKVETIAPVKEQPVSSTDNNADFKIGQLQVLERVDFNLGGSAFTTGSFVVLDKLAAFLSANSNLKLRIVGHTSDQQANELNGLLSQQRARAVFAYLLSKGITADRMKAQGMGPRMPVAANNTEEGRSKNRRIEIEIIK